MRRPWSPPACSGGVRIGQWHYTPSPFPAIVSARVLARSTSVPSRCSRRRTRAMKQETRRVAYRAGRLRLADRCLYTMFARRRLGARETVIRGSVASARSFRQTTHRSRAASGHRRQRADRDDQWKPWVWGRGLHRTRQRARVAAQRTTQHAQPTLGTFACRPRCDGVACHSGPLSESTAPV